MNFHSSDPSRVRRRDPARAPARPFENAREIIDAARSSILAASPMAVPPTVCLGYAIDDHSSAGRAPR